MDQTSEAVKDRGRVLYITKPYTYRPKEPPDPPKGRVVLQKLTKVLVGGESLAFNGQTRKLVLAGTEYDVYEWLELRHRIDLFYEQDGQLQKVQPEKSDWDSNSSQFISRNLRAVAAHRVGTWKKPPWWLRWLYSAVISKEIYGSSN